MDPILPGQPAVKKPMFNIAGNLLGTDEAAIQGGVIEGGAIGAAALDDREAGAGKQLKGSLLEASLGEA